MPLFPVRYEHNDAVRLLLWQAALFLPGNVGNPCHMVQMASECEKIIAQTVEETYHRVVHPCLAAQCYDPALGSAAYGAAHIGGCCSGAAPGQDEGVERRKLLGKPVDLLFQM